MKKEADSQLIEKVVSTELAYNGNFLKIWRDQVKLPNGHQSFREYIKHPGAAMVIPMLENGNVVILRQYRHAVGQVFYEFPAGKCDRGEESRFTAERELREEAGLQAGSLTYLTRIHPVIGYSNESIDLYLAEQVSSVPRLEDPDELLLPEEITLTQLREKIWNHELSDPKTQIGSLWLFRHLNLSLI